MEVVVDTNVFIDALFKGDHDAQLVLKNEHLEFYRFVVSDRMREELVLVFLSHLKSAGLTLEEAEQPYRKLMRCLHRARRFNPSRPINLSPDPADNEFIACAIEAPVGYLVTRNGKHFQHALGTVINVAGKPIQFLYPDEFNAEMLRLKFSGRLKQA